MEIIFTVLIVMIITIGIGLFSSWLKKKLKHCGGSCSACNNCDEQCKEKIIESFRKTVKEIKAK